MSEQNTLLHEITRGFAELDEGRVATALNAVAYRTFGTSRRNNDALLLSEISTAMVAVYDNNNAAAQVVVAGSELRTDRGIYLSATPFPIEYQSEPQYNAAIQIDVNDPTGSTQEQLRREGLDTQWHRVEMAPPSQSRIARRRISNTSTLYNQANIQVTPVTTERNMDVLSQGMRWKFWVRYPEERYDPNNTSWYAGEFGEIAQVIRPSTRIRRVLGDRRTDIPGELVRDTRPLNKAYEEMGLYTPDPRLEVYGGAIKGLIYPIGRRPVTVTRGLIYHGMVNRNQ